MYKVKIESLCVKYINFCLQNGKGECFVFFYSSTFREWSYVMTQLFKAGRCKPEAAGSIFST